MPPVACLRIASSRSCSLGRMVGERDEADGIDPEDAILGSGENNDTESKLEGELFPKESICESISSLFGKSLSENLLA
jgi:hypothetical protein